MKFSELNKIMQIKIRKSLLLKDFDTILLANSYVNTNSDFNVDSIYCEGFELLFENNMVKEINKLS